MMRRHVFLLFFTLLSTQCLVVLAQDENSDDVFDRPLSGPDGPIDMMPREEMMNEGSDSFETSTEMIEIPQNETSLEVNPVQKTAVFSPITPLEGGVFNFSAATIEEDSTEDADDSSSERTSTELPTSTTTLNVITFSSLPIQVDEVDDRRVLKEKELPTPAKPAPTTQSPSAVSDPSEADEVGETPFDQSALEGLFEQDGSVIDTSATRDPTPAFPILKMSEEDSKIISNKPKETTTMAPVSSTTTTEASTTMTTTTETETETTTTSTSTSTTEEPTSTTEEVVVKNATKVFLPAKSIRTPITFRITSLEFSEEFNDIQSGPSKKLTKAVVPSIAEFINSIAGEDNFVSIDIKSFTKGSVIVTSDVLTKKSLGDAQMAANLLEAAVARNNSMLSDYTVDSLSITVDGMTSQAYIDSISTQTSTYSLSSLMIVIIVFALVVVVGVALFIITITSKRRRQSTMKLSMDDTIRSITPESNDTPHNVHLMSYGTTPRASQRPGPITKTQIDETNSPMY